MLRYTNTACVVKTLLRVRNSAEHLKKPIRLTFDLSVCMYVCVIKVQCTAVEALRLCTGRTAHRGSRGIAVLYRH